MPFHRFKKLKSESDDLNRVQDNIEDTLQPIVQNTRLDSHQLTNIQLKSGQANNISHGLGRLLVGWSVVGKFGASDIYEDRTNNKSRNLLLILHCTNDVLVNLEVW